MFALTGDRLALDEIISGNRCRSNPAFIRTARDRCYLVLCVENVTDQAPPFSPPLPRHMGVQRGCAAVTLHPWQ